MPLIIIQSEDTAVAEKLANTLMKKPGLQVKFVDFTSSAGKAEKPAKEVKLKMPKPDELKDALTEVKEELGVQALKDLLTAHGAKNLKTLDKKEWPTVMAEAMNLLKEANEDLDEDGDDDLGLDGDDDDDDLGLGLDDDDDDDDLGLDDDDDDDDDSSGTIDLPYVKKLASQYSDKLGIENQREIISKHGVGTSRSLGKAVGIKLAGSASLWLNGRW